MNANIFSNISKIIERDSKSTTYKFALLRGVIDIIQDSSPFIKISEGRVHIPTGLLVEKWLLYYYPLFESSINIPQINGATKLAFAEPLKDLIFYYANIGGFSAFYNDLKNKGIPQHIQYNFLFLVKKIKDTITKMPMKYIGRSISDDFYSIFKVDSSKPNKPSKDIDMEYLINNFGTFSIPFDYYEAFQVLGSFINGQDSIFFKWAEFSVKASNKVNLTVEMALNFVLKSPIEQRDVKESIRIYNTKLKNDGKLYCIWTGKPITEFVVDHMIPFSVWKNNDLWNLLPTKDTINSKKSDKIPSLSLLERRKDLIFEYWELSSQNLPHRFNKEINISLLGGKSDINWQENSFNQLKNNCNYLISKRGFEEWNL